MEERALEPSNRPLSLLRARRLAFTHTHACASPPTLPTAHSSTAMPLFNGSAPAVTGESIDHLMLYTNGGVGMLGQHGVPEAAVRPERWAWVVVTRSGHEVNTYVNGRHCAKVDVTVKQGPKGKGDGKKGKPQRRRRDEDDDDDDDEEQEAREEKGKGDGKGGGGEKEKKAPERLCIDPTHLALFASLGDNDKEGEGERGLSYATSASLPTAGMVRRYAGSWRGYVVGMRRRS